MTRPTGNGTDPGGVGSFQRYMEHGPPAIAVTHGAGHTLEFANQSFRRLTRVTAADVGRPIAGSVRGAPASGLLATLNHVFRTGAVARDIPIADGGDGVPQWHCTVWPQLDATNRPERLVIELWESSQADLTLALQREVAERMLLSALRERDATEKAEASSRRATFLAAAGRRLAESLDLTVTQRAVAELAIPSLAAWCIVDVFDSRGAMHRLRIVHPDATKQVACANWKADGRRSRATCSASRLPCGTTRRR